MTGRYQAYSEYKDSGVDWLGSIPSTWKLSRIGGVFEERREKVSDKDFPALSVTRDGIVPQLDNAAKTDAGDNRKKVCADDFVINSRSDRKGSSGTSKLDGSVSLISIVLMPRKINPAFAHHLLRSYPFQHEFYRYGKGIHADLWSTNYSEMKNILLAVPTEDEQQKIANFLDHETAKIDTLITKQEKLIELLKEKRQAVISHAVTKGLNPQAPMKDSGVEWLGEVPEHWGVVKCGYLGNLFGSEAIAEDLVSDDGDIPFIKVSTLSLDSFDLSEKSFFVDSDMVSVNKAKSNYIAFPKRGAAIFTNKVNIVTEPSFIDPNLMGWEINNRALPEYIAYMLKLRGLGDIADVSTVPQINNKHIEPMKFPLPPLQEQTDILKSLKGQVATINELIEKSNVAITLIKERKTALISAAVTGKIDVRNWEAN
ncbi:restriction endonuclease subunit S [Vibrio fortis]|uniref:Restriction endonuclease subunit S n=1 Tax=Vibrio fortis TaxID=212667 RepID=A0A066UQF2_9VIBR|nr:restriction endonuclease subunit S [Vibrio fortis]KDN29651.1 restriction endonuclease subunit S [Vibrio fortis]